MKAVNIIWDVDDVKDLESLPDEIIIPAALESKDDDIISDYLSETTGFCR